MATSTPGAGAYRNRFSALPGGRVAQPRPVSPALVSPALVSPALVSPALVS